MIFKELLIVAHLKHFKKFDGMYSYEPYVRELVYWAKIFDNIVLYTELTSEIPRFALSRLPENILIRDLHFESGPGIVKNIKRIIKTPLVLLRLFSAYRKAEVIHTRSSGIPTMAINVFNWIWNKPTIEKWATNCPPDRALGRMTDLNFKLLKYVPSNTRVMVYSNVKHHRFILSFPALFSGEELREYRGYSNKNKWGLGERKFICVARLHRDKNVELIFNSILHGVRMGIIEPGFSVTIVGGGPDEQEYRNLVEKYDLSDFITLVGKRSFNDTLRLMSENHFLIMPGINEGWPKVINEALTVDCVPIVVRGGNAEKVMNRMKNPGLLFENTPSSLISVIKEAKDMDQDIIKSWIERGSHYNCQYTLENYAELIKKTYVNIDTK